jgi:hypothetical protein
MKMRLFRPIACLFGLVLLLNPVFFMIYRLSVFSTVPRDDYAPYVLWLANRPGGFLPEAPFCYRIISVLAAVPFYHLLPAVTLTNTPASLSGSYLQSTAALSAVAYLAWITAAMLVYGIAIGQSGLRRQDGVLAGALLLALGLYEQVTSIDPLAIALITACIALVHRRWAFCALVLISIVANEKIALVMCIWLSIRCLIDADERRRLGVQWGGAVAAVLAYILLVKLVQIPGNSYQVDPEQYAGTLFENLSAYATARGVVLNILPIVVIVAIAAIGYANYPRRYGLLRDVDVLLIPALILVALVLTHLFQAGRIAMFAAPFLVVPAAARIGVWARDTK